jgi:MoaA/NifB/PqqE/SkfB family radical SAM enzyme
MEKKTLLWDVTDKYNHKILTAISTVITEENASEIYKFKTLIPSLGVDYLFFMSIYDCGNARIKNLKSSDYFIKIIPLECIAADYFQDQMFNEMMSMVFKLVKTNYQSNNEVATFVLDSIKQRLSFKEILYKLSKKYKVDLSVLIRDIGGYISDLIIEDIITMEY